jgi:hypothetical protein
MPPLSEPRLYLTSCRGGFDLEVKYIIASLEEIHLTIETIGWDQYYCLR